jgi:hypothetical protein
MDLYCQKCGEPWDLGGLWDFEEDDYEGAREDFLKGKGCPACAWGMNAPATPPPEARATGQMIDILGDDLDGVASELEEIAYLGIMKDF